MRQQDLVREADKNRVNMPERERQVFFVGGLALLVVAALRRGWLGLGFGSLGASLIYQSMAGISPIYQLLGKNRAVHDESARISVPHEQGIHIRARITIHRPAEEIYNFLRNFNNLPLFLPQLKSMTIYDDLHSRWTLYGPMNKLLKWDIEIVNDEPNRVIAWRTASNPYLSHAGAVRLKPSETEWGTDVSIEMEYMPFGGKVAAMLLAMLGQSPEDDISHGLWRLKRLMELSEQGRIHYENVDGL
jgi:uncharacterized membrane protein